jgi:Fe-S-cluster containining protein
MMHSTINRETELLRRFLVDSDKNAMTALLKGAINPRLAELLLLQFITNHLKDKCQNCSICCQTNDLIVITVEDAKRIASYLKVPCAVFVRRYVRTGANDSMFLRRTLPCGFLKGGRCSIYPVRPSICAFYPFLASFQSDFITGKIDRVIAPKGCSSAIKAYAVLMMVRAGILGVNYGEKNQDSIEIGLAQSLMEAGSG